MLEYMQKVKALLENDEVRNKKEEAKLVETCIRILADGIEKDIIENDYTDLLNEYSAYFKTKKFRTKNISTGTETYHRARIGKNTLQGSDQDMNKDYIIPFYGKQIGCAPKLHVKGGRFNREGYSYLYLASTVEACLAEIHLQVGQDCTVAQFKSTRDVKLMNLVVNRKDDLEIQLWYRIMTQPVYDAVQYKYLVTQFLADVFRENFRDGIYFKSSQGEGKNIVCFDPSAFALKKYSEKIYRATSIQYRHSIVVDSADEYTDANHTHALQSAHEKQRKEQLAYIEELSSMRKASKKRTVKN